MYIYPYWILRKTTKQNLFCIFTPTEYCGKQLNKTSVRLHMIFGDEVFFMASLSLSLI